MQVHQQHYPEWIRINTRYNRQPDWEKLPAEIIRLIFSHLSSKNRENYNLREICTSWRDNLNVIDVRSVKELFNFGGENDCNSNILVETFFSYCISSRDARKAYRNFRIVVNLIGGWEKFRSLPEIQINLNKNDIFDTLQKMKISELIQSIIRVKMPDNRPGIIFKHFNAVSKDVQIGVLTIYSNSNISDWYLAFNDQRGIPIPPMDLEKLSDKVCDVENPIPILRDIFVKGHIK